MIRRVSFFVFCFLALLPTGSSHASIPNRNVQGVEKGVLHTTTAGQDAANEKNSMLADLTEVAGDNSSRDRAFHSPSPLPPADTPAELITNPLFLWGIICLQGIAIGGMGYYLWKVRLERIRFISPDPGSEKKSPDGEFSTLTHLEQFSRLQELAEFAVEQYSLELSRITRLTYQINVSFMVEARRIDNPEAGIQKYFLKIFGPGYQPPEMMESEMQWLSAIRRDTDLTVPEPLANRENLLVTRLNHPSVPDTRYCTMVSWLKGAAPIEQLTEEILEDAGVFLGKLHQQVVGYKPPSGFERKTWDLSGFQSEMLESPVTKIRRALNKDLIDLVENATEKIQSSIESVEHHQEVYGLIHGNLLKRNYLVHGGEIRVVDFGRCGWGFFGYDLAVTLSQLVGQPKSPQFRAAFLKGYKKVRMIGDEIESLLGVFIAARYVYDILRLAGNKNDGDSIVDAYPQIERYSEHLERFLQRG